MEVRVEKNPLINRIWSEWTEVDRSLSGMTVENRMNICKEHQWVFQKETNGFVDLESLYSSVHHKHNREEFIRWFYIVCSYIFSRIHLGENSYAHYQKRFKDTFKRDRCTSKDFPKQVLLVLALMGYITGIEKGYSYNVGGKNNHGYIYKVDKEKLLDWSPSTPTYNGIPEWVMSRTESLSFDESGKDTDRISWTQHPEWLAERQYQSISSIEVVKEGFNESSSWLFKFSEYQDFYSLSEDEQEELESKWLSYQKLRNLSCGILGSCKDDSETYAGRFYSPLTNMKSSHRHQFLRLDGELVTEVDVSSAQPTFLGIILYLQTGVMSEWLKQSLKGTFYEWIGQMTNTKEDRPTVKKWMMRYLYSCYGSKKRKDFKGEHKPTYGNWKKDKPYLSFQKRLNNFLKVAEPEIYHYIDECKKNPQYKDEKGKWCSTLSYQLVKQEVAYIQKCIHSLPQKMKFYTIHDCIAVKESDSMEVKSIMEKVSREMYGEDITLGIKRENTSAE